MLATAVDEAYIPRVETARTGTLATYRSEVDQETFSNCSLGVKHEGHFWKLISRTV
jgi:hypothetical protein